MSRGMLCAKTSSSAFIPCWVLKPGASVPLICADRNSLNRMVNSGPLTSFMVTRAARGTGCPVALRT